MGFMVSIEHWPIHIGTKKTRITIEEEDGWAKTGD
jgi:hypothetical protein